MKLHSVKLSRKQRQKLMAMTHTGVHPARVLRRAQILLKADDGLKDADIADHVGCTWRSICDIRKRYCTEGLERALEDAPRSGRPAIFTAKQKATVVALACTEAPEGHALWTLDLLVEKAGQEGINIGRNKVWTILRENDLKPWRKKNVVHSASHAGVQGTDGRRAGSVRGAV